MKQFETILKAKGRFQQWYREFKDSGSCSKGGAAAEPVLTYEIVSFVYKSNPTPKPKPVKPKKKK